MSHIRVTEILQITNVLLISEDVEIVSENNDDNDEGRIDENYDP